MDETLNPTQVAALLSSTQDDEKYIPVSLQEEGIQLLIQAYDSEYSRTLLDEVNSNIGPLMFDFYKKVNFYTFLTDESMKSIFNAFFRSEQLINFMLNFTEKVKLAWSLRSPELTGTMIGCASLAFARDKGSEKGNVFFIAPETAMSLNRNEEEVRSIFTNNLVLLALYLLMMNFHFTFQYITVSEKVFEKKTDPTKT